MVVKERAVEWFYTQCIHCRYYAGIANDKVCNWRDPCLSTEEIGIVKEHIKQEGRRRDE